MAWWDDIDATEREMAKAICKGARAHAFDDPDNLVLPHKPMMAIAPEGHFPIIDPKDLVPLWTCYIWAARAALEFAKTLSKE